MGLDKILLLLIFILVGVGLLMVYEASAIYSDLVFGGKYHFLILQSGWVFFGFLGMFFMSRVNIQKLRKISPFIFILSLVFLILVILPIPFAPEVNGARRWFVLNPFPFPELPAIGRIGFQPSEFAKFACILFFSAFFSSTKIGQQDSLTVMAKFSVLLAVVVGLIMLEPDFTTAFIMAFILLTIFFLSNAPIFYFLVGGPFMIISGAVYAMSSEYRRTRIKTLFDPESVDKLGAGYHIRQVMIALGSGGFWGLGFGKSRQKYAYLPEVTTDSIFAVAGEEFGFVGTVLLIILFMMLIFRGLKLAQLVQDRFQSLLVSGVIAWISLHIFINIGSMVRLLPLTGVPLPLISYGGSSTIFMMWALGLVLNISRGVQFKND